MALAKESLDPPERLTGRVCLHVMEIADIAQGLKGWNNEMASRDLPNRDLGFEQLFKQFLASLDHQTRLH